MSILHTVNKSPFSQNTLASCIAICGEADGILLLEDGVFGAMTTAPWALKLSDLIRQGTKVYALEDDVKARGLLEKLLPGILLTDYARFVQLSIEHRCVQSWY